MAAQVNGKSWTQVADHLDGKNTEQPNAVFGEIVVLSDKRSLIVMRSADLPKLRAALGEANAKALVAKHTHAEKADA